MILKHKCVVHAGNEVPAVDLHTTILLITTPKMTTFNAVVTEGTASMRVTMIAILAQPRITSKVMVTEGALPRK